MDTNFIELQPGLETGVSNEHPALQLNLTDQDINSILDSQINKSMSFYKDTLHLDKRRKTNEEFWLGKQLDMNKFHEYQVPAIDNLIWQNTEHRIAIAAGREPSIILTPGDGSLAGRDMTRRLSRAIDIDFGSHGMKRIIKNGLRHNHLYFNAAIKCVWDATLGPTGDYRFELVRPNRLLIDHSATIPEIGFTTDNCKFIVENVEESVATVIAKFPNKRTELLEQLKIPFGLASSAVMMSTLRYQECWFTYNDTNGQIQEGVVWRYNNIILRKMRNPYYDWEGYNKPIYDTKGMPILNEWGYQEVEQKFRNFFNRPRKPYILFSYQNLGRSPMDDTTAVEQAIQLQRLLNKRERQITELADRVTDKFAFNNRMDKAQAQRVTSDPNQAIWVDTPDDIREVVQSFSTQGPPAVLFNSAGTLRQQIDSKFNTHGGTRGENTAPGESGISKQITREGDLITSDDIVDITVERVVEEMASWSIQFMKLMYVDIHYKSKMGKDGEVVREAIQRDMIDDGISVTVTASTADKLKSRDDAINLASAGSIDPYTMFEEMDVPDPKERTKRLLAFKMGESPQGDAFATYQSIIGISPGEETAENTPQQQGMEQMQEQLNDPSQMMPGGQMPPGQGMPPQMQPQAQAQIPLQAPQVGALPLMNPPL